MLADGRSVPAGTTVDADICIVGAGPAGITVARQLKGTKSEIVLIERGEADWSGVRAEPVTTMNGGIPYDIPYSRAWGIGGSIHKWRAETPIGGGFGRLRELDAVDFESRHWVNESGWPFGKATLAPYYKRARELFDVDWPTDYSQDGWDKKIESGVLAGPDGQVRSRAFSFANPGVFASTFKRELTNAPNVIVLTNSTAIDFRCDDQPNSVSSVVVSADPQQRFSIRARHYILAAGGIENARLLLASRSTHARGIGNPNDLVGRYFMEHPHYASGLAYPTDERFFSDKSNYAVHNDHGLILQRKYSLDEETIRSEELLRTVFLLVARPFEPVIWRLKVGEKGIESLQSAASLREAVSERRLGDMRVKTLLTATRGAPHIMRDAFRRVEFRAGKRLGFRRYTSPQLFRIQAMSEQAPNPQSRVILDDRKDEMGVPYARLIWTLSDLDLYSIRRSQELFQDRVRSAGVGHVESLVNMRELPPALTGGNHHMGTTRMSDDQRRGVVDRNGLVHTTNNLFVAGSSVFPTGGYANPTLTILALALRLGDHLKEILE